MAVSEAVTADRAGTELAASVPRSGDSDTLGLGVGTPTPPPVAIVSVPGQEGGSSTELSQDMARTFLRRVFPGQDRFTFQTIPEGLAKGHGAPRVLHGALVETWDNLARQSGAGSGVFFTLNRTNGQGRTASDIVQHGGVLAVDLDGTPVENLDRIGLKPHAVVETSSGRFHAYWRVEGVGLDEHSGLMGRIAAVLDGDSNISDLPRVLRLPGTLHQKGVPFLVTWRDGGAPSEPYAKSDFLFGLDEACKRHGVAIAERAATPSSPGAEEGDKLGDPDEVAALLGLIPNGEDDDVPRGEWVKVGHAAYGASGGEDWGFDLWETWSLQRPQSDSLRARCGN